MLHSKLVLSTFLQYQLKAITFSDNGAKNMIHYFLALQLLALYKAKSPEPLS